MAGRQSTLQQCTKFAAYTVALLLSAWFAPPAIAASNVETRCDDVATATLEIPTHKLKAEIISHDADGADDAETDSENDVLTPTHYLAPRAEASVREAFEDAAPSVAEVVPASDDDADSADDEELPGMKSRLPGVTDSELARYRRQMYRIDI